MNCFEKLPDTIKKKIKLVVAGRGPYSRLVESFSNRHDFVDFLGLVDYHEMVTHYCRSDVFVIPRPSNPATENLLPMKLLEAMAMENIVLVSDVKGMTEVVDNGINGVVFRPGDETDFITRVCDIVDRMDAYETVAWTARESVVNNYSWQQGRSVLASLYASLA